MRKEHERSQKLRPLPKRRLGDESLTQTVALVQRQWDSLDFLFDVPGVLLLLLLQMLLLGNI